MIDHETAQELRRLIEEAKLASQKKDAIINELIEYAKQLQEENTQLREYVKWLQGRGSGPQ